MLLLVPISQVDSAEFIHCKEVVDEYLHSLEFSLTTNAVYIFNSTQIQEEERAQSPTRHLRESGRDRGDGQQGDSDEYYDGFRNLYNEEATPGAEGSNRDDSFEQEDISSCPPLHPAVN